MFIFNRPPLAVLVALTLSVLLILLDRVFDLEICMPLTNVRVLEGVTVHGATDGMNDPNAALHSNIALLPHSRERRAYLRVISAALPLIHFANAERVQLLPRPFKALPLELPQH